MHYDRMTEGPGEVTLPSTPLAADALRRFLWIALQVDVEGVRKALSQLSEKPGQPRIDLDMLVREVETLISDTTCPGLMSRGEIAQVATCTYEGQRSATTRS